MTARRTRGRTASRATLSARGRREFGLGLRSSWRTATYAYPRGIGPDRGKRPSYPIDPRHVYAARSYAARRDTASSLAAIDRRLARRYGSVANALAAARRSRAATSGRRRAAPRRTTARRSATNRRAAVRRSASSTRRRT